MEHVLLTYFQGPNLLEATLFEREPDVSTLLSHMILDRCRKFDIVSLVELARG